MPFLFLGQYNVSVVFMKTRERGDYFEDIPCIFLRHCVCIFRYFLDEGLYRCEGIDGQDGCTYYFTTETEADSKNFVLYVQKDKGN